MHRASASAQRGYTLVELLAVVAMIGILAALAIAGYTRWHAWARTAEAKDLVGAIATGQHRYYTQTQGYLSCSSGFNDYYPMAPNARQHLFHDASHADATCWRLLAADADGPTYMSFITVAGNPGEALPGLPTEEQISVPAPEDRPWFVAMAVADQDEDGDLAYFMTSSLQPGDVHIENEDE